MKKKAKSRKGLLVVISGPSGVGKSSVVQHLMKATPKLKLSLSATTRPPRPNEKNGRDYLFLNEKEFFERQDKHEFLEWAKVHGYYYGTPKSFVEDELLNGSTVVMEVDVQGAAAVKEAAVRGKIKTGSVVFIFLIPPSVDILAFRLKKRKTENEEIMNYRLRAAVAELQVMEKYDYIIVNDEIEKAAAKIRAIINVEKERVLIN